MLKFSQPAASDPAADKSAGTTATLRTAGQIPHRQAVVDTFNGGLSWWSKVYGDNLPRGFFSHEMTRRKQMVIEAVTGYVAGRTQQHVLECGCGPGGILRDLLLPDHEVFGIDINSQFVTEMSKACPQVKGTCCDIEEMPFTSHMFDVVICVGVLPYLQQDERAIAEMSRVLKPGGLLVLSNPNYYMVDKFFDPYYYFAWPLRQAARLGRKLTTVPHGRSAGNQAAVQIRRFRSEQLDPLFRRHGLDKCQDRPVSYGPFKIWKKDCMSIRQAIRMSEWLVGLAARKGFRWLVRLANHRVTYLVKQPDAVAR